MIEPDQFIFTVHQFILISFCLFLVYFAWKDQAGDTYDRLNKTPLKVIVPVLIGLFIGLTSLFIYEWGSIGIFLAISYALLITLSLFDPKYAVSFFILLLISRPWEIFNDQIMGNMARDSFILCFLSFAAHRIIRKRFYFQWNTATAFMLFFALWTFFSIIPSSQIVHGLESYGEVFIKGVIVYFLIVNVVDKIEYIVPIQTALVLGITEKSIMSFYNSVVLGQVADDGRLTGIGILENSNDIAAIMILVIPFTLALLKGITLKPLRFTLGALVFFFYAYLIWQSKSRGAILGLGMFAVCLYWLKAANKKFATIMVIIGISLSIFGMSLIKRNADDVEGSTENRKIFWRAGLNMGLRNPIFGVGYEGFRPSFFQYAQGNVGTEGSDKTVHSTWLLALAETGVVGLVFYLGIWVTSIRFAWAMRVEHPEFLLGLLSYGTAITFLSHTYLLYPYILQGLTIACGQFYIKNKEAVSTKGLTAAINAKGLT